MAGSKYTLQYDGKNFKDIIQAIKTKISNIPITEELWTKCRADGRWTWGMQKQIDKKRLYQRRLSQLLKVKNQQELDKLLSKF